MMRYPVSALSLLQQASAGMVVTDTFPPLCFTAQAVLGVLVMLLAISAALAFAASVFMGEGGGKRILRKAGGLMALAALLALAVYVLMPEAARAITGKALGCLV